MTSATARAVISGAAVFVGTWALACAAEAVVFLRWPSPLEWEPLSRGMVLFASTFFSLLVAVIDLLDLGDEWEL